MSATPPAPTSPPTTDNRETVIIEETRSFLETELVMGDSAASALERDGDEPAIFTTEDEEEDDDDNSSSSTVLSSTGNELLDAELTDLHAFFHIETEAIDADSIERQQQEIWIRITLPISLRCYDQKSGTEGREDGKFVLSLRLKLRGCEEETPLQYEIAEFIMDGLWPEVSQFAGKLAAILERLTNPPRLSIVGVIEEFYFATEEELNYPDKDIVVRDFFYPIFDARHWGRYEAHQDASGKQAAYGSSSASSSSSSSPTAQAFYRARALYDFQALMQGELSFQENDILQVFANLGNGWLTARKIGDDSASGLIPENYIERL